MFFASRDDDATRRGDGNEATADQLEGLSIKELKALADKRKVDLTGCTEKGDLVNALVAARVARVDEDDPHILPDETRRIHDQEAFDIQRIVELFGGYIGERAPLTLEELQNYEWPIKDIVGKFRTAGMRDGARRTLEEARKIYEEIPEDVRRTPEAISDYLWGSKRKDWSHLVAHSNGGSDSADGGFWEDRGPNRSRGNATVSDDEFSKACHADRLASEKAKIKTAGKAAAIAAGLSALVTAAPKLIREVQSNKSAEEIKEEVRRLLGEAVWNAMCQAGEAGLLSYLRLSLGPFAGSIVGAFAVESIVATWAYVHGDMSARECIKKITSSVAIACVTVAFPRETMGRMICSGIIFISCNLSDALRERIPIIIDNVSEYVTGRLGVESTVAGTALVLCSQTGNAVYIIGLLGAEASTGTAIASLNGAAKANAALAWLGGGTKAKGGGGMALGRKILNGAKYGGYFLAAVGSVILARKAWIHAKSHENVSFCAQSHLSGTCVLGPDKEPVLRVHLSSHGGCVINASNESLRPEEQTPLATTDPAIPGLDEPDPATGPKQTLAGTTATFAPGARVIYKDGTSGEVLEAHHDDPEGDVNYTVDLGGGRVINALNASLRPEERAASATPPSTPPPRFIYIMVGAIMGCLMTIIVLALTMGLQEAAVSAVGLLEKVPVPFQNASRPVLGFYTSEEFHIPAPLVCSPGSQLHGLEPTF